MTSIPILDAYLSPDGTDLHVACDFCWAWHHHGTGGAVAEVEHRAAHCWVSTSPYLGRGYSLRVVGPWDLTREKTRPWVGNPLAVKPRRSGTRSADEARPRLTKIAGRAEPLALAAAPLGSLWDEPLAESMIQITLERVRLAHEEQPPGCPVDVVGRDALKVSIDAARSRGDTVALRNRLNLYEQHAPNSFQSWAVAQRPGSSGAVNQDEEVTA